MHGVLYRTIQNIGSNNNNNNISNENPVGLPADIYQGVYLPCPYSKLIFLQNNCLLLKWPVRSCRYRLPPVVVLDLLCTFLCRLHLKQKVIVIIIFTSKFLKLLLF